MQQNNVSGCVLDPACDKSLLSYFSRCQWYVFWFLFGLGVWLRWYGLDDRALHHDESLHAMWGKYFIDNPDIRFYKYDPMLHGPLLYNVLFFVYFSLGDSIWSARFPVALMGTVSIVLPLLFRTYFKPITSLILIGFIAISPTLVYWSRFIREDYFTLFGVFLSLSGATIARGRWKAYLFFSGFFLQFCSKENSYVHLAILLGYLIFEAGFTGIVFNRVESLLGDVWRYFKAFWLESLLGLLFGMFIYVILYGAWGLYPQGIIDGLFYKSISYWWNQSAIERIKGPFMFHYYVFFYYELLFLILLGYQAYLLYKEARFGIKVTFISTLVLGFGLWIYLTLSYNPSSGIGREQFVYNSSFIFEFLKTKDGFDVFGAIVFCVHSVLVTVHHLLRRERHLAVTGYFFTATLFSYSYLGEKVPWLSLYPFIAGIIYLALYFQDYYTRNPVEGWRNYSLGSIVGNVGIILTILGIVFLIEQYAILGGYGLDQPYNPEYGSIARFIVRLHRTNFIFIAIGLFLAVIGVVDDLILKGRIFGRVNLLYFLLLIGFVYNLRSMVLTNFVYAGNEREVLSQVHTAKEAIDVARMIEDEVVLERRGYQPHVYVSGDAIWPLTWYFRKLPTYDYIADEKKRSNFLFRIEDWKEGNNAPEGYTARRFNLRGWFVPDYNTATLKRMLHYSINHEPWNMPGFAYASLYYRNNPENEPLK
jgi:uncharacterized protein (TIGR03663 family)